jgi:cell wall-associated NlpC family hydrolase
MKSVQLAGSRTRWRESDRSIRRASRRRPRRAVMSVEFMEPRVCLSAGTPLQVPVGSGVDSIALGDVNGDQIADIAVASLQNGTYQVAIYNGAGQANGRAATGYAPQLLATIPDPFSMAAGPLDVALGDFTSNGISELAISAKHSNQISLWTFQLKPSATTDGPLNQPVCPVSMGPLFTPTGLQNADGINVAAVSMAGNGVYQLLATAANNGTGKVVVLSYGTQTGWQVTQTIGGVPVNATKGLSIAAGDLTDDGMADIVVGSQADGQVAAYSEKTGRWTAAISPLGENAEDVRVSVVSSEGASGSIVMTGINGTAQGAIVPWNGKSQTFSLPTSPGSGELLPLGAGYVYQPGTILPVKSKSTAGHSSSFRYSKGPASPVVLFAATGGSSLVVQDFQPASSQSSSVAQFTPSAQDKWVEPLWGSFGNGFVPLQVTSDPDATGSKASTNPLVPPINLIVLPANNYISPYSINLSGVPASVTAGLLPLDPVPYSGTNAWGPVATINTPPVVTSETTTQTLQQRVIAAYASFLGIDYQHHHNPLWQPTQNDHWNVTGTLSYQSQGVDCTNFTAAAYADALGIKMSGDTIDQSNITAHNTYYRYKGTPAPGTNYIGLPTTDGSPAAVDKFIHIQIFKPKNWGGTYQGLVNLLQPGDILYINGKHGGKKVTHAITWLGQYGVGSNGVPLIIDSTGITPQHVDSNNHIIPEGVHIRPFADGDGSTPNTWYYWDISHVMRILGTPRTSST